MILIKLSFYNHTSHHAESNRNFNLKRVNPEKSIKILMNMIIKFFFQKVFIYGPTYVKATGLYTYTCICQILIAIFTWRLITLHTCLKLSY